jgi:hypothetical protein
MKRYGNARRGSSRDKRELFTESSNVSSVPDECCGDGRGSYVVGRIDGAGCERFSVRK